MKNPLTRQNREYRVLAIAVLFFGTGLLFFWFDRSGGALFGGPSAGQQGSTGVVAPAGQYAPQSGPPLSEAFQKDPAPSTFHSFTYSQSGINGNATLPVSATCHDAYIAVLIFPAAVDYRAGVNTAIYNQAFPCVTGNAFTTTIATSDIGTARPGKYYLIVADEGTSGTWYNPR